MSGLTAMNSDTVEKFVHHWEDAFNDLDHHAMAAYYTQDAVLIGTQLNTLDGRPAIDEFWQSASNGAKATRLTRTVHVDEVASDGELAYVRGTVALTAVDDPIPTIVRYVTIWRRQPDDLWRIAVDISSVSPRSA